MKKTIAALAGLAMFGMTAEADAQLSFAKYVESAKAEVRQAVCDEDVSRGNGIRTVTLQDLLDVAPNIKVSRQLPSYSDTSTDSQGPFLLTYDGPRSVAKIREYFGNNDPSFFCDFLGVQDHLAPSEKTGLLLIKQPNESGRRWTKESLEALTRDNSVGVGFINDVALSRTEYEELKAHAQQGSINLHESFINITSQELDRMYFIQGVSQAGRYDMVLPDMTNPRSQRLLQHSIVTQLKLQKEANTERIVALSNIGYGQAREELVRMPTGVGTQFKGSNPYNGAEQRQALLGAVKVAYQKAEELSYVRDAAEIKTVLISPVLGQIRQFADSGIDVDYVVFNQLVTRERKDPDGGSSVNFYQEEFDAMGAMIKEGISSGVDRYVVTFVTPDGWDSGQRKRVMNFGLYKTQELMHEFKANGPGSNVSLQLFVSNHAFTGVPGVSDRLNSGSLYPVPAKYAKNLAK